jgi:SSS family solute:Na+ symporter
MTILDFAVVALYALAMLAVGRYYARRTKTADDYLLGGRTMSPFMIGLSLFATLTSTLTYLALPGEIIKNGPMIFAQLAAYPFIFVVVGWVLIPWIMRQRVTSGYELLETRLGVTGRLLGSGMFVALRTFWMASILYATTSKVLAPLLGLDSSWTPWLAVVMGLITIIYTAEGGLRAVVLTDAMQSLIMFVGAVVVIGIVSVRLGGIDAWWPNEWAADWPEPVFGFRADVRITFLGAALNMFVWMVCTAGSDQMAMQRYLSTRDAPAARRSFGIHLLTEVFMMALLTLVGFAVLAYFTAHPEEMTVGKSPTKDADQLLPHFIVVGLPAGLSGLVIAALLSAAMSSLSSGLNSSSAVITNDFIGRFRSVQLTQHQEVRLARYVSVAVGVVAVSLSTVVGQLAQNLLELCIKVVNLLTAPLFVLFCLALFVRWATPLGALVATFVSIAVAVGIAFFKWFGLEMLWTGPCSLAAGVVAGMLVSLVPIGRRGAVEP